MCTISPRVQIFLLALCFQALAINTKTQVVNALLSLYTLYVCIMTFGVLESKWKNNRKEDFSISCYKLNTKICF
jgi:hypothetical protein